MVEPLVFEGGEGAVGFEGCEGVVDAVAEGVAVFEEHAELFGGVSGAGEDPDDGGVGDLDCGDEVGGGEVEDDAVDLAGVEGGFGCGVVVVDLGGVVGLDDLVDVVEAGGADGGAESEALEVGDAGRRGCGGVGGADDGLFDLVVAVGEVDDFVAFGGDGVLLDVEVPVLFTWCDDFVEAGADELDGVEAELVGEGEHECALIAGAG